MEIKLPNLSIIKAYNNNNNNYNYKSFNELFIDYFINNTGFATVTGLFAMTDGIVNYDKIIRFLLKISFDSKNLWKKPKFTVIKIRNNDTYIIFYCKSVQRYLKRYEKVFLLVYQVFKNKGGSRSVLNLVYFDILLYRDIVITTSQRRWKFKDYRKSLKYNIYISKSTTKTVKTQNTYILLFIVAVKLEFFKIKHYLNCFVLKANLFFRANHIAF